MEPAVPFFFFFIFEQRRQTAKLEESRGEGAFFQGCWAFWASKLCVNLHVQLVCVRLITTL